MIRFPATRSRWWARALALALFVLALCAPPAATAQLPGGKPAAAAEKKATVADPLGRETPLGTVTGLSRAVRRGDLAVAARYLQRVPGGSAQAERLAGDVAELLDRYFTLPLTALSSAREGSLDDGLPPDRERLPLALDAKPAELSLVRVEEPGIGPVWLVAADSLARVPGMLRSARATPMERFMPPALLDEEVLGFSLAQWVVWAGSILLPLLLFGALVWLLDRFGGRGDRTLWTSVRVPLVLGLTLLAHLSILPWLGFGVSFRFAYARAGLVAGVFIAAQLVWSLLSAAFEQARRLAQQRGRADTRSLILLGERVVKVFVVLIALLLLLALAGFDTRTALAGLGIGGIALALGAQKSVENLLGGIFLLTDKALAVGDFCRVSGRLGWVEDVTLRSVRLRTLEQTLLSVPAGVLANGNLENFATRRKMLVQTVLRLRHDATPAQLQQVLTGIRALLAEHPKVEQQTARIHLVEFGVQATELELFAYLDTSDQVTFLGLQEGLLLRAADLVAAAGTAFAEPVQLADPRAAAAAPAPV